RSVDSGFSVFFSSPSAAAPAAAKEEGPRSSRHLPYPSSLFLSSDLWGKLVRGIWGWDL
ncbi:hypothetical protein U1Q18_037006, partial [Sarracenia purpurea var. burkii]